MMMMMIRVAGSKGVGKEGTVGALISSTTIYWTGGKEIRSRMMTLCGNEYSGNDDDDDRMML